MVGTHTLIREESLCRLLGQFHVATSHAVATDNQLTLLAHVQHLALVVHHIEASVDHRTANRDAALPFHQGRRATHRTFRRTIHIQDDAVLAQFAQPAIQTAGECLRTDVVEPDLSQCLPTDVHIHDIHQEGRGTSDTRHTAVHNRLSQQQRIMYLLLRSQADRIAVAQRDKLLNDGHVEGEGSHRQRHHARRSVVHDFYRLLVLLNIVRKVALFDEHTLRPTRRARGIDAVSEVVPPDGVRCRVSRQRRIVTRATDARDVLHADQLEALPLQSLMLSQGLPTGQQDSHVTILHAEVDAVVRIGRDEREEGSMRFQDALLRIVSILRPFQQHTHQGILAQLARQQHVRHAVRFPIQFRKANPASRHDDSSLVRMLDGMSVNLFRSGNKRKVRPCLICQFNNMIHIYMIVNNFSESKKFVPLYMCI